MRNKNKILVAILAIFMAAPLTVSAVTFTAQVPSGQTLTFSGSEGGPTTVSRGNTYPTGDLIIPAYVLYNGVAYYITSVSDFSGCTGLTSVKFENGNNPYPYKFIDIYDQAFANCTGLTTVELPARLRNVGAAAFAGCTELQSTYFSGTLDQWMNISFSGTYGDFDYHPESCTANPTFYSHNLYIDSVELTAIGPNDFTTKTIKPFVFIGMTSLTSVVLHDSVQYSYRMRTAFYGCTGLTGGIMSNKLIVSLPTSATGNYVVPDGVECIGDEVFRDRTGLTSITLPASLRRIGEAAFRGCTGLTSLTLPDGLEIIDAGAFYDCSGITRLAVPQALTSMGAQAFRGTNINYLMWNADSCTFQTYSSIDNIAPEYNGVLGISSLDTMVLGPSARKMEGTLPSFNTLVFEANNYEGSFNSSAIRDLVIGASARTLRVGQFSSLNSLRRLEIRSDSITVVGDPEYPWSSEVFSNNSSIDSLVLAEGLTHVSAKLLNGLGRTSKLFIPTSITHIDSNAFSGWDYPFSDHYVYYGGTMTQWCNIDFANRYSNPVHNRYLYVGGQPVVQNLRIGSDSVSVLVIPDGLTTIKKYSFYGLRMPYRYDSISLPATIASVGEQGLGDINDYYGYERLHVSYAGSLAQWCNIDFEQGGNPIDGGRTKLFVGGQQVKGALAIPNGVTTIKAYTFQYMHEVTSLTIPASVTTIGDFAFLYCDSIANIVIPDNVLNIGDYAFGGCTGATNVTIGSGVRNIGAYAFAQCGLFLPSITAPATVASIGENAFMLQRMLYYNGNATDGSPWGALCLNGYIEDSIYYTSSARVAVASCHPLLVNAVIPEGVQTIGDRAFYNQRIYNENAATEEEYYASAVSTCNVSRVTLPSTLRTIGEMAFYRSMISGILNLPSGLQSIGYDAFRNCDSLVGQVVIPTSVTHLGDYAFAGCDNIASVVVNASIDTLGNVFQSCRNLTSVHVGGTISFIGNNAFSSTSSLQTVTLSGNVVGIGERAFSYSSLRGIALPNSLTYIGPDAFGYCHQLASIVIPNSVTYIGHGAFDNCTTMKSALIGNGVDTLQENLFVHCDSLEAVIVGSGVKHMKYNAFGYSNPYLQVTMRPSTPPTLEYNAFPTNTITVYVPCGTATAYRNAWNKNMYFGYNNYSGVSYVQTLTNFSVESSNPLIGSVSIDIRPTCTNSSATVSAQPVEGCRFLRWSDGSTDNPHTLTVTDDMVLTAIFSDTCIVTLASADNSMGTVGGAGAYHWGETVTITATPAEHHHFVSWSDGDRTNPRQILLVGDTALTATFAIDTHRVNATSNNILYGGVTGGGNFEYASACTLTATAYTGYRFRRWSNGVTANPYTFAVVEDIDIVAEFVSEDDTVGINAVDATNLVNIYASEGRIVIEGADGQLFRVFSIDGRTVFAGGGTRTPELPNGV